MLAVFRFVLSWQQAGFHLKHQDTKMLMLAAFVVKMEVWGFFYFFCFVLLLLLFDLLVFEALFLLII